MAEKLPPVTPVVGMPSADLITYRFDMTDKNIESLRQEVRTMGANFATKEELSVVSKRIDNWVWFGRVITIAAVTALATAIGALIVRK